MSKKASKTVPNGLRRAMDRAELKPPSLVNLGLKSWRTIMERGRSSFDGIVERYSVYSEGLQPRLEHGIQPLRFPRIESRLASRFSRNESSTPRLEKVIRRKKEAPVPQVAAPVVETYDPLPNPNDYATLPESQDFYEVVERLVELDTYYENEPEVPSPAPLEQAFIRYNQGQPAAQAQAVARTAALPVTPPFYSGSNLSEATVERVVESQPENLTAPEVATFAPAPVNMVYRRTEEAPVAQAENQVVTPAQRYEEPEARPLPVAPVPSPAITRAIERLFESQPTSSSVYGQLEPARPAPVTLNQPQAAFSPEVPQANQSFTAAYEPATAPVFEPTSMIYRRVEPAQAAPETIEVETRPARPLFQPQPEIIPALARAIERLSEDQPTSSSLYGQLEPAPVNRSIEYGQPQVENTPQMQTPVYRTPVQAEPAQTGQPFTSAAEPATAPVFEPTSMVYRRVEQPQTRTEETQAVEQSKPSGLFGATAPSFSPALARVVERLIESPLSTSIFGEITERSAPAAVPPTYERPEQPVLTRMAEQTNITPVARAVERVALEPEAATPATFEPSSFAAPEMVYRRQEQTVEPAPTVERSSAAAFELPSSIESTRPQPSVNEPVQAQPVAQSPEQSPTVARAVTESQPANQTQAFEQSGRTEAVSMSQSAQRTEAIQSGPNVYRTDTAQPGQVVERTIALPPVGQAIERATERATAPENAPVPVSFEATNMVYRRTDRTADRVIDETPAVPASRAIFNQEQPAPSIQSGLTPALARAIERLSEGSVTGSSVYGQLEPASPTTTAPVSFQPARPVLLDEILTRGEMPEDNQPAPQRPVFEPASMVYRRVEPVQTEAAIEASPAQAVAEGKVSSLFAPSQPEITPALARAIERLGELPMTYNLYGELAPAQPAPSTPAIIARTLAAAETAEPVDSTFEPAQMVYRKPELVQNEATTETVPVHTGTPAIQQALVGPALARAFERLEAEATTPSGFNQPALLESRPEYTTPPLLIYKSNNLGPSRPAANTATIYREIAPESLPLTLPSLAPAASPILNGLMAEAVQRATDEINAAEAVESAGYEPANMVYHREQEQQPETAVAPEPLFSQPAPRSVAEKLDFLHVALPAQRSMDNSPAIQKQPTDNPMLNAVMRSIDTGAGKALDIGLQSKMNTMLGGNFEHVRVHTGDHAAEATREIGAEAFTLGNNIFFAPGRFQPDTPSGQALIGHELTHIIQNVTLPSLGNGVVLDTHHHEQELEREAIKVERAIMTHLESGNAPTPLERTINRAYEAPPTTVQRTPDPVPVVHLQNNGSGGTVERTPDPGTVVERVVPASGIIPVLNAQGGSTGSSSSSSSGDDFQGKEDQTNYIIERVLTELKKSLLVDRERLGLGGGTFF